MTGDGVNDTLALKDADVEVAMGNGAPATRAVAQLVLLDGKFSHLPDVVAQGRRVIANIERAANLFLVKNVYSLVLAALTVATSSAYPLAPIQLTLISTVTIGLPGFVLALGPNTRRYVPGFLHRVLRFAAPTGLVIGLAAYAGFWVTRLLDPSAGVDGGRTTATLVVLIVSLWTVLVLARPLTGWKLALVATMTAVVALIVAVPALATNVFLLHPTIPRILISVAIGAAACLLVEGSYRTVAHRGAGDRTSSGADARHHAAADLPHDKGAHAAGVPQVPIPRRATIPVSGSAASSADGVAQLDDAGAADDEGEQNAAHRGDEQHESQ
jgi:cation-transporting ATPase E